MTELLSAYQAFEAELDKAAARDGYSSLLLHGVVEVARVAYRSNPPEMGQVDPYHTFFSLGAVELSTNTTHAQERTALALAAHLIEGKVSVDENLMTSLQEYAEQPIAPAN